MKKFSRSILAFFVIFILMLSMSVQMVMAETDQKEQELKLVMSEPDEEGYFTASLMVYNATFSAMHFGFSFDNTVMEFVDKNTKEKSDIFDNVAELYQYSNEKGEHKFYPVNFGVSNEEGTAKVAFYSLPTVASDSAAAITIGEEGFKLYDFSARLLKNEDPSFDVLDYPSTVYVKDAYVGDGRGDKTVVVEFVLSESLGGAKKEVVCVPVQPEKTLKQKRKERLVDSLILNIGNYAAVDDGFLKWIDENNKEVVPFIEGDRTYVPIRFISEAFGAEVNWDSETQEISINIDDKIVKMYVGKNTYKVNEEEKEMDAAPFIKQDRTMVPVRFISEALGKSVYWDPSMKLVFVTPEDRPWDPKGDAEKDILPDALLIMSELVRDLMPKASN